MTFSHLLGLAVLTCSIVGCQAGPPQAPQAQPPASAAAPPRDFITMPGGSNALQLRHYTYASPEARGLYNTLEVEAYGEHLLESPGGERVQHWLAASATNTALHQVLIDHRGPVLMDTNA